MFKSLTLKPWSLGFSLLIMDEVGFFRSLCGGGVHFKKEAIKKEQIRENKKQKNSSITLDSGFSLKSHDDDLELNFFRKDSAIESNESGSKKIVSRKISLESRKLKKNIFKTSKGLKDYLKENGIKVRGESVPQAIRRFSDLESVFGVDNRIVAAIKNAGFSKPTAVQKQAITAMITGRDVLVTAPTGSGKTLVFIISIIQNLIVDEEKSSCWEKNVSDGNISSEGMIKALIVSPTRELASQIKDQFRRLCPKISIGESNEQIPMFNTVLLNKATLNSWRAKRPKTYPHILVVTPQRLVTAIEEGILDLSFTSQIVFDEADRLLDDGLLNSVDSILSACTSKRLRRALFSATIPSGVESLAATFMGSDYIKIITGKINATNHRIKQELLFVGQEEGRLLAIRQMLVQGIEPPVIIFSETIERATQLFHQLVEFGISVDMIHSGRSQSEREIIISRFRSGKIWFLITTELLSRGLDFPQVKNVINYDFPRSTASYIHRIGRTGRAGRRGRAITFFTKEDARHLRIVANVMRDSGCDVSPWVMQLASLKSHK